MSGNIIIYILVMAFVTYLIRMTPLTLIRKEITNKYIKSFLFYVPYVTLSVMIFPAIMLDNAGGFALSGLVGLVVATVTAYFSQSMVLVSVLACLGVFVTEILPL